MTTQTAIRTAVVTGDTYAIRDALKRTNWSWDASRKAWLRDRQWESSEQVFQFIRTAAGRCGRLHVEFEGAE